MLLAFIGERIVGAGTARALTGVGVVMHRRRHRRARGARRARDRGSQQAERMLLALYAVGALAVALYLAQSDLSSTVLGKPLERDWPKLATMLGRAVAGAVAVLGAADPPRRVQLRDRGALAAPGDRAHP